MIEIFFGYHDPLKIYGAPSIQRSLSDWNEKSRLVETSKYFQVRNIESVISREMNK